MSGYITKLNGNTERTHVHYNNCGIVLYDRTDRVPFGKSESFFMENLT